MGWADKLRFTSYDVFQHSFLDVLDLAGRSRITTFRLPEFACANPSVKTQSVSILTVSDCNVAELNHKAIKNKHSRTIVTYAGINLLFDSI